MTFKARFDGRVLVPLAPVDLPTGCELEVDVIDPAKRPPRGSPQALLQAIRATPSLGPGDAEALERAIEEGESPPQEGGIFDEVD